MSVTVTPPAPVERVSLPADHLKRGEFYVCIGANHLFYKAISGHLLLMSDGFGHHKRKSGQVCTYEDTIGRTFLPVNVNIQWEYQ